MKLKGGMFHYKQKWRPHGGFMQNVFQWKIFPNSAEQLMGLDIPMDYVNFLNTYPTVETSGGLGPGGLVYPYAGKRGLGQDVRNILRVPAFKFLVPGHGADSNVASTQMDTLSHIDINVTCRASISVVGNNLGNSGNAYPRVFEFKVPAKNLNLKM